jgi:short-subunit dehydrogenase
MHRLEDLQGRTAVVTGGSSGIGREIARRLAASGARVVLVARRPGPLEAAAAELRAAGAEAFALPCDVGDKDQVLAAAAEITARYGPPDVLVNNAGFGGRARFVDRTLDEMERMVRVNFLGALYWTRAVVEPMVERGRGWIVFVASVAGRLGVPGESVYSASKFALVGFAETLSMELEDAGVHVLSVLPAAVDTPFFSEADRARLPAVARRGMLAPGDVADAVIDGLRRGRREITVPRRLEAVYVLRALFPALVRRGTRRATRAGLRGAG